MLALPKSLTLLLMIEINTTRTRPILLKVVCILRVDDLYMYHVVL